MTRTKTFSFHFGRDDLVSTATEFLAPGDERAREHPGDDSAAPWGRKSDGTPRSKPGRPTGTPNRSPRRPAPPRPRAEKPAGSSSRRKPAEPDYRGGINGILQMAAAPLLIAGTRSDAALANAYAVTQYGPGIADALHDLAVQRPEVAAVLDRVLAAGPYGALLAAALPLAVQVATNHGLLPAQVATAMGAAPVDQVAAAMRGGPQAAPDQRERPPAHSGGASSPQYPTGA